MRVVIGVNRGVYNRIPEAFRMRVVIGVNRGVYNRIPEAFRMRVVIGLTGEYNQCDVCDCVFVTTKEWTGKVITDYYMPVKGNTALLSSHRGCSKDKIRPTLVLRPSTKLSLLLFRQF